MLITLVIAFVAFIRKKTPAKIFKIYSQKNKWFNLKYVIILLILYIRKWRRGDRKRSEAELRDFDKPQALSSSPNGFNAVFYIGGNKQGWRFIMGTERRHQGIVHSVLYFYIPGRGIYKLPHLPDAMIFSTEEGAESTSFSAAGIHSEPKEPMKRWTLKYKGDLFHNDGIVENCSFDGEFSTNYGFMDYDTDLSPKALARSIATEVWSRKYFKHLETAHQSRIEQMGKIRGYLRLNEEEFELNMDGFRDLSFGHQRDWSLMHRYAFFMFFLDNGNKFSIIHVNQPCTGSNLKIGYICEANGTYVPIDNSDFELYQHGESGEPPKQCAFQVEANNKLYTCEISVVDQAEHFVGNNWEARMVERFIDVKVNGISGVGVSEFHYSNKLGRKNIESDPLWYKQTIVQEQ